MDSTRDTRRKSVMAQQHLQLTLNVPKECKSLELSTLPTPLESKEQIALTFMGRYEMTSSCSV